VRLIGADHKQKTLFEGMKEKMLKVNYLQQAN